MSAHSVRQVVDVYQGLETSDGAGVNLTRIIGTPRLDMLDPFLMLDAFRSDDPEDYAAGFPDHPHRGFETVTYLLAGHMRHGDHTGNSGVIRSGGVQWMTAGRGIVHSEMPVQEDGLLFGFQLWVNLPASHKMIAPHYQDIAPEQVAVEERDGVRLKVIAGTTARGTEGPVRDLITPVTYLDAAVAPGAELREPLPRGYNAFAYVFEGAVEAGGRQVPAGSLALLGDGDEAVFSNRSTDDAARMLLIAGQPLNEPVARHGPFVMNTREEIMQAFADYREGRLGAPVE